MLRAMSRPRCARLAALAGLVALAGGVGAGESSRGPPVSAGHPIELPADYGSHPEFRTEWWYVTGWLHTAAGDTLGFQITFFRVRPNVDDGNPSSFTPRQLLIAHCAIADPKRGRLWQDQRIRRAGMGLAEAQTDDTNVSIDGWTLVRHDDRYAAHIEAEDLTLDLQFLATQPPMLNGPAGVSRKGPAPQAASYYYSVPHLTVTGRISRNRAPDEVHGEAWLDHEWSSEYLDAQAVGWDWIGINLDDGGALMAFRIRGPQGGTRWAGGSWRGPDGRLEALQPDDLAFVPSRTWRSPRTAIEYPVAWRIRVGTRELQLQPLLDDQENDTRLSTGAIYWEGAVSAYEGQRLLGHGYLELTGYGERLRLAPTPP
jgi:predicted secreted hydrolase